MSKTEANRLSGVSGRSNDRTVEGCKLDRLAHPIISSPIFLGETIATDSKLGIRGNNTLGDRKNHAYARDSRGAVRGEFRNAAREHRDGGG